MIDTETPRTSSETSSARSSATLPVTWPAPAPSPSAAISLPPASLPAASAPPGLPAASSGRAKPSPSRRIAAEILTWAGTDSAIGSFGELSFRIGRREIGHLHGDAAAHFFFPLAVWEDLLAEGRITEHPVFLGRKGPAARRIRNDADVEDVLAMMRLNHARLPGRRRPHDAA